MIIGIVGPEASRWTKTTEAIARKVIRERLMTGRYAAVTSGACHKGGVDIWAREIAAELKLPMKEYPAEKPEWHAYMKRNRQIAKLADVMLCVTPKVLPPLGIRTYCRYCDADHVQNGGCWTLRYARSLVSNSIRKQTEVVEI